MVVDPRRSETAAIADQHLFVRPGGDAALLFGLLHTLFAEGLTRDSHLPVDGLDQVREAVAGFSADVMSPLCAVPAEQIRQLARDLPPHPRRFATAAWASRPRYSAPCAIGWCS